MYVLLFFVSFYNFDVFVIDFIWFFIITKGPATADKSEGALFLRNIQKITIFYKISKVDKNRFFIYI